MSTLVARLRTAGLRLEPKSRGAASDKRWLIRHVPDPRIVQSALPAPALHYASDATGLRGDYAVLVTDKAGKALKAYALYAEAGAFMVVTRFAATSATTANAVVKQLKRIVHADRYSYLFMHGGGLPRAMRTHLARLQFGQHAGYGYVTKQALRDSEAGLKRRMARTGRKLLPSLAGIKGTKRDHARAADTYREAVREGLRSVPIPTRFVENEPPGRHRSYTRRSDRTASGSNSNSSNTSGSNSNSSNDGNVRARRRRPMLLALGR